MFSLNPLIPRVKPWLLQNFLTFDYMDRTLECSLKLIEKLLSSFCSAVYFCFFFNFSKNAILENISSLDLALLGVKGLTTLIFPQSSASRL